MCNMRSSSSIRSILLTTAFGEPSRKAAPMACMLARTHSAKIHVLHVVPVGNAVVTSITGMTETPAVQIVDRPRNDARRRLKAFIQQCVAWRCVNVVGEMLVGSPIHEQIVRYAREHDIDLIVTGTHGDGMLHRLVRGSVTKAVVEHAPCPVLLVPCVKVRQEAEVPERAVGELELALA